ncbi:hypothetical protein [Adhaeribacter terreus]|uniref:Lipoprotein n=1 Tax=Adhaeribacter terreus TaxID=529703 RepID=A0ABW0E965_9BACT
MIYKKLILLLTIGLTFFACQKRNNEQDFVVPSDNEINKIIQAVLIQDSLDESTPIQWELKNPKIAERGDSEIPPPPPMPGTIYIDDLLSRKIDGKFFITPSDTFFIKVQSLIHLDFKIDSVLIKNNFMTEDAQQDKFEKTGKINYYRFTKPLFSKDKKKAYIQLDIICRRLCGAGLEYFLIKRNNKWIIADTRQRWIS